MSEQTTKTLPTHVIYAVTKTENKKPYWRKIGGAWANKDGKGYNLKFDVFPIGEAQIVVREPLDEKEEAVA